MDEKELWVRYKEGGDESARNELVVNHLRVVKYVAGRMAIHIPSNIEMNDLMGWGALGLMDAVEKFDHTQDVKFATYATIRIRGSIIDQIRTLDWAPRSLRAMARKVGTARERLRQQKGGEPSSEEIGDELETSAEEVEQCIAQVQTAQVLSLDDYLPGETGEESRKVDVTPDLSAKTPVSLAEATERRERIALAILELPDQQQKVLNLYYHEELTLKEIGAVLGVSESRICQVHSAAVKQLKKAIEAQV